MRTFTKIRFEPIRGAASCRIPMRFGVPFERGQVAPSDLPRLAVHATGHALLPASAGAASLWSDGSVRWASVSTVLCAGAASTGELELSWIDIAKAIACPIRFESTSAETVTAKCGDRDYRFSVAGDSPSVTLLRADSDAPCIMVRPELIDSTGVACAFSDSRLDWDDGDPLRPTVTWRGVARSASKHNAIDVTLSFCLHADTQLMSVTCCLGNPAAARHRDGRWDLGDLGSVHFRSAGLSIALSDGQWQRASVDLYEAQPGLPTEIDLRAPWSLLQASSGGDNWQSRVHVDASNTVSLPYKGFRLTSPDRDTIEGERAEPILRLRGNNAAIAVALSEFWQNFPSGLSVSTAAASVSLFPDLDTCSYELQGGEQKTQQLWFDLTDEPGTLQWTRNPPRPIPDAAYVAKTHAVPLFTTDELVKALEQLVLGGVKGNSSFFAKREIVDEFGWRHFGDLYADHETLNYSGELPLVSHYNNQYDAIESFWRQGLRTNDPDWMNLSLDLAAHVVDIDIYNTDQDRPEYNGGLFWHTDHYAHAHTATHRTYSRHNDTSCDGEASGGPGSEHCYTSGLVSLYFATGEPRFRDAALGLIEWITRLHEGSDGMLEFLERAVRKDLPLMLKALRGKQVDAFLYPLTRGTGNYINALVDGYLLTGEAHYLESADKVIRRTLHPAEDVNARDLLDSELRWSYLVLLQSLYRFIAVLSSDKLMPDSSAFASACIVHFADWMVENEYPFLDDPAKLDFPNETWSAQDLRKAWVLGAAAALRPKVADRYLTAAETYVQEAQRGLSGTPNAMHTRILILLLQNRPADVKGQISSYVEETNLYGSVPVWRAGALLRRTGGYMRRALVNFSLRREFNWVRFRLRDRLPRFGRGDI